MLKLTIILKENKPDVSLVCKKDKPKQKVNKKEPLIFLGFLKIFDFFKSLFF